MKPSKFFLVCLISVLTASLSAETIVDYVPDRTEPRPLQPFTANYAYKTAERVDITIDEFALMADSGSLKHDIEISAKRLQDKDIPAFPSNMENVTANGDAVRLLPNGEHFSKEKPALITLAYEPTRIPMGYRAEDVYTFYFDQTSWQRLERVGIDTAAHTITSLTTHFTDFANAVISVPEMPESKAFVPTTITDLPDVNPLQGIPMIAVPTPNNHGTAELTYPIELPAGRQGMQPNIDLHYSSAGGNGILGVGWDLPLPAVTIDIRWGVPRYDLRYETEAYLVNGEPILLHDASGDPIPLPHQAADFHERSSQDTRFYARDTRVQNVYARHGQTTSSYWWTMTDTEGRTYYYGYDILNDTIDESSVLKTEDGHIGYWALTYIVDPYGNYVKYTNTKYYSDQILLTQIDYTGHLSTGLSPIYHIYFRYTGRSDRPSDGRLGLLRSCRYRLCHILLTYTDQNVERQICTYRMTFEYDASTLFKNRLQSITKIDKDIIPNADCFMPSQSIVINSDTTDNFINTEEGKISSAIPDWGCKDSIPGSTTTFNYGNAQSIGSLFSTSQQTLNNSKPDLSSSTTENWSLGGAATVGFGWNPAMTKLSGGVNYNYSHSTGSVQTMLMDLNGDGLPDQVYEENGQVKYRKQNINGTFANPVQIIGLSRLSRDISSSHTFGAQLDFVANLSYNPSFSDSYTDIYFADVNGDGLPDWITPNGISINHLNSYGDPQFTAIDDQVTNIPSHGNNCEKGIVFDGEVDERLGCRVEKMLVDAFPLDSILPEYEGPVSFINEETKDTLDSEEGIYTPTNWNPFPLSKRTNNEDFEDIEPKTQPVGMSLKTHSWSSLRKSRDGEYSLYDSLSIWYPGDDYSFRLYNDTIWVYHLESICEKEQTEPNVDIVRVWVADRNDVVRIRSSIQLIEDTTASRKQSRDADGVRCRIQGRFLIPGSPITENNAILLDDTIDADDYSTHNKEIIWYVREGDILYFRLSANQDRRFDNVRWEQTINTISGFYISNSSRNYICTDEQRFRAPQAGMARVIVQHQDSDAVPITVHVKKNYVTPSDTVFSTSLVMHTDTTDWFAVPADSMVHIRVQYSGSTEPVWSKTHVSAVVEFAANYMRPDSTTVSDTTRYYPSVQIPYSSYVTNSEYKKLFGPLHKGWGQFAYNDVEGDSLIIFSTLHNGLEETADYMNNHSNLANYSDTFNITTDTVAGALEARFDSLHIYDPFDANNRWVPMLADPRTNTWMAYGNVGRVGQYLHSTSRMISRDVVPSETDMLEYDSPVPTKESESNRITHIRKENYTLQHGTTFGVGVGVVNWGESLSWGDHEVRGDYMDLNGDGFPDFIGRNSVQYSNPWGGIGNLQPLEAKFSNTFGSGGVNFGAALPLSEPVPNNNIKTGKYKNSGMGGSASGTVGTDMTNCSFIDMNADGLPDIVDARSARVRYNLGYSFTDWHYIYDLAISGSSHIDGGISVSLNGLLEKISNVLAIASDKLDFSLAQYSISGGISASGSLNHTDYKLVDVNGDGYPDLLFHTLGSNTATVLLFDGDDFSNPQTVNIDDIHSSSTGSAAVNVGVTMGWDWVLIPIKFCFGIHSTPYGCSSTTSNTELVDMNGDGYVDLVSRSDNGLKVRYNRNGENPVNLLTKVTNPTGQTINIAYSLSQPSVDHRGRSWVMSGITDAIPFGTDNSDSHEWHYQYNGSRYDNHERTDYGYNRVETSDLNNKIFIEFYHNDTYIHKGEKSEDLLFSYSEGPFIGHRYSRLYFDAQNDTVTDLCEDATTYIRDENCYTDYYEGAHTPQITTAYKRTYDASHRLIRHEDYGDILATDDEWTQVINYLPLWQVAFNQIVSPKVERILDAGGNTIRKSRVNYSDYGRPQQIIKEDTIVPLKAMTTIKYDIYGNIDTIFYPHNAHMERAWLHYQYDYPTHSHPTRICNPFGEQTLLAYDLRWGQCIGKRDPAGNEIRWRYDRMGRLVDIVAPQELHDQFPFSIHYCYRLPFHDLYTQNPCNAIYDKGKHYVYRFAADNTGVQEVSMAIYDARGQKLQTKSRQMAEGSVQWITDGIELRDPWYRVQVSCPPFVDNGSLYVPTLNTSGHPETHYTYDILDRPLSLLHPDGHSITWDYTIAPDFGPQRLRTRQTDENGIVTITFTSPQGWVTKTIAGDGSWNIYTYNPIGELLIVRDADWYVTWHEYNMFGWRTKRVHPDAHESRWMYDPAGNVIQEQTARHLHDSTHISYNYCFDKLIGIHYPFIPTNDVSYKYDAAGRMVYWEDGTGSTQLYHDALGNIETTLRHVVIPTETYAYNFQTETHYDSFGRIKSILYPDGENVQYQYYLGGRLQNIKGYRNGNLLHNIVDSINYDAQGKRIRIRYGNAVASNYTYSASRNWLTDLQTISPGGILQDIDYSYDHVGNITELEQYASSIVGLGGYYRNHYFYDQQYRLIRSDGGGSYFPYDFAMSYSPAGRIGRRYCSNSAGVAESRSLYGYDFGGVSHQPRVVFDTLTNSQPEYFWDANGNLAQTFDCYDGAVRFHQWDDINRLRLVLGPNNGGFYGYDANGERVYKIAGRCEMITFNRMPTGPFLAQPRFSEVVLYPNPYITITCQGYTKHYFAGNERVATAIGNGQWISENPYTLPEGSHDNYIVGQTLSPLLDPYPLGNGNLNAPGFNQPIDNSPSNKLQYCTEALALAKIKYDAISCLNGTMMHFAGNQSGSEPMYYYHGDHLGSASWITEQSGKPIQYIHYLPYGEILANQMVSPYDERFKFTGKELDAESGYYYYGARYLLSELGYFISSDPLTDKYSHLSSYIYCNGNPLRFIDPDGRDIFVTGELADQAVSQLQSRMNGQISLNRDNSTGLLSYTTTQNKLKGNAKRLAQIIDNHSIHVNIQTTSKTKTSLGNILVGGAFMGNYIETNSSGQRLVKAYQEVNPNILEKIDAYTGTMGKMMMHEVTEAYEGARITYRTGEAASPAYLNQENWIYERAHIYATPQSIQIHEQYYDRLGMKIQTKTGAVRAEWYINYFKPYILQTYP